MHPEDEPSKAVDERSMLQRISHLEKRGEEQMMQISMLLERVSALERLIGINKPVTDMPRY